MAQQQTSSRPLHDAVERSASAAEEIHRTIADLPLEVLERAGLFEKTVQEVRRIQNESIGAVYDTVRAVNRHVAELASDLLHPEEDESE